MTAEQKTGALELERGTTLGKYEVLRKLATGGMAELYLARVRGTANFEKIVVLKRILPHIASDPTFVQMFLDEARLAATLQHPNIADVYDVGDVDGTLFFTMEYVHGQDVRALRIENKRRDETIPLAIALAIVHGTVAALDYAHERQGADGSSLGLIHRDVSSSNVMVSYDGAIKLVDFGIAEAALQSHKTQTGTLKGKTPYMSPEQCRGLPLDRRSDLFSLGVVMFELTVGRRPFRGDNDFAIMEQLVHGHAPSPSSIVPGYPAELEAIVMKLLARERDDRYDTAEDVLHELEPFLAHAKLWASSRQLGKYMRTLFADTITAWERASHEGISLAEHVAATVTSHGFRSHETPSSIGVPLIARIEPVAPSSSKLTPTVLVPSLAKAPVRPPVPAAAVVPASRATPPPPPEPRAKAPSAPPAKAPSAPAEPRAKAPSAPPEPRAKAPSAPSAPRAKAPSANPAPSSAGAAPRAKASTLSAPPAPKPPARISRTLPPPVPVAPVAAPPEMPLSDALMSLGEAPELPLSDALSSLSEESLPAPPSVPSVPEPAVPIPEPEPPRSSAQRPATLSVPVDIDMEPSEPAVVPSPPAVTSPARAPVYPVLRTSRWPARVIILLIVLVLLAGAGVAGYFVWQDMQETEDEAARPLPAVVIDAAVDAPTPDAAEVLDAAPEVLDAAPPDAPVDAKPPAAKKPARRKPPAKPAEPPADPPSD